MKLTFYQKWPGGVWTISDPHFNHLGMLKYERKEFKNIDEHNERILNNILEKVGKDDTLLILGDLGFDWEQFIAKIPCYKVLVLGNHDRQSKKSYEKYFDEVYAGPLFINRQIIVSHEPVHVEGGYFINIHGHLHGAVLDDPHFINVSCALRNYSPQLITDLVRKEFSNLKSVREAFLREWYTDHYVFTDDSHQADVPIYPDGHIVQKPSLVRKFVREILGEDGYETFKFSDVDWSPLRKEKFISEESIRKILTCYYYQKTTANLPKNKSLIDQYCSIFQVSKGEDLIGKELIGVHYDSYWDKFEDREVPYFLRKGTILNVSQGEIIVDFGLRGDPMKKPLDLILEQYGDKWWIDENTAKLTFGLKYDVDFEKIIIEEQGEDHSAYNET